MANDRDPRTGAPPREVHVSEPNKKSKWWLWLLPLLGLLALLFALSQCGDDREEAPVVNETVDNTATAVPPVAPATAAVAAPAALSGLGTYLAGTEPLPRTFVFERLNFDTGSSTVRPADQDEVNSIAAALKQHPNARIRLQGFADARGNASANAQLGQARAESVKAALAQQGVEAGRIETGSGGEAQPAETNATTSGQAENRRTELVVLQR